MNQEQICDTIKIDIKDNDGIIIKEYLLKDTVIQNEKSYLLPSNITNFNKNV